VHACVAIDDVRSMHADVEWRVQDSVRGATDLGLMAGIAGVMQTMVGAIGPGPGIGVYKLIDHAHVVPVPTIRLSITAVSSSSSPLPIFH